jgi:hypothetical protein
VTDADLARATSLLDLSPADLQGLRTKAGLAALKRKAKKSYRAAAMRLHPDRTGGDAAKAEDFKLVSAFMDELDRMVPPEPVRRKVVFTVHLSVRVPATARMG